MMEAIKPGLQGEHGISRKAIAQGVPDCFGVPVVTNSRTFYLRTRGRGCDKHPAFPVPSFFEGLRSMHRSGISCRGNAYPRPTVIARSEATKQSMAPQRRNGLLRFARNDDEAV